MSCWCLDQGTPRWQLCHQCPPLCTLWCCGLSPCMLGKIHEALHAPYRFQQTPARPPAHLLPPAVEVKKAECILAFSQQAIHLHVSLPRFLCLFISLVLSSFYTLVQSSFKSLPVFVILFLLSPSSPYSSQTLTVQTSSSTHATLFQDSSPNHLPGKTTIKNRPNWWSNARQCL